MAEARKRAVVEAGAAGGSQWQLARRPPPPELAPFIVDACGYLERTAGRLARREFPHPAVVVIFELGPPLRVFEAGSLRRFAQHRGGFVAGLGDRFTLTEHAGFQHGLQWNLTPLGARLFFGLPHTELSGRVVALGDLKATVDLTARLAELPGWDARFDLLEALMRARVAGASPPASLAPVMWAMNQILCAGGTVDIASLTKRLGYSPRHAIALFREHVGLPPKRFARVVRFHRLLEHLRHTGPKRESWAELAATFGYFDQAHLARDVRAFTGLSPTETAGSLIDIEALAAEVNSVQEDKAQGA